MARQVVNTECVMKIVNVYAAAKLADLLTVFPHYTQTEIVSAVISSTSIEDLMRAVDDYRKMRCDPTGVPREHRIRRKSGPIVWASSKYGFAETAKVEGGRYYAHEQYKAAPKTIIQAAAQFALRHGFDYGYEIHGADHDHGAGVQIHFNKQPATSETVAP